MDIKFKSLTLQNFKSHQELTVNFGERTVITGDNTKGKSSIGEAVTWLLYGTDLMGSTKFDPFPSNYEAEETLVSLLLSVDGMETLLGRSLNKGKATYYINEVPSKATDYNELLDKLFDKDLFLSLYNPNYFFTLHPTKEQRPMLLKYVSAPANKEVFKELPRAQAEKLAELVKKHSMTDLEKIHRENKTKLEKMYIAAQSRTKTLKEQYENNAPTVPLESLQVEDSQLLKQIKEIEKVTDSAGDSNREYNNLQSQVKALTDQVAMSKERWPKLKNEVIEDTCRTCKRPLDDEAVQAVEKDKEKRTQEYKQQHANLVAKRNALREQLKELEYIDVTEQINQVRDLEDKRFPIQQEIIKHKQIEALKEQLEEAQTAEKDTLDSLNESIFIIDSIKAFYAQEAELQAEKVQALFDILSINLFKEQKNGDIKPDFEIEMDGKGYRKLSLSEGIRAGLELREVLSEQSDLVAPVFVDNAESITKFKEPTGQLIISRVVAGQELTIEVEE
ncbi:ATPase [Oceanobacillus jordanicus]|uniref:Nuclease SbcCD subunit C n=1 Tax=Oceanobacillus jordanicus TaxID=2867266 RepID=A0AAW5B3B2_9BACI|nr:ATPase [Oceanobacillus jordanicus]MCG3418990.1 ATPase [Oceanobacillus jordanicus]